VTDETDSAFRGSAGARRARRAALIAQQEALWSLATPADAGILLRLWYAAARLIARPLLERQRAQNAAVLQTFYVIAEQYDALALDTREQLAALEQSVGVALARSGGLTPLPPEAAERRKDG
jgi:hypothetical protein